MLHWLYTCVVIIFRILSELPFIHAFVASTLSCKNSIEFYPGFPREVHTQNWSILHVIHLDASGLFLCHSACHASRVFSLASVTIWAFNRNSFRDLSLGFTILYSCIGNSRCLSILFFSFSTLFCLLMWEGSMLTKYDSNCSFVLKTVPEIVCIAFLSWTSTSLCERFLPTLGHSTLQPSKLRLWKKSKAWGIS